MHRRPRHAAVPLAAVVAALGAAAPAAAQLPFDLNGLPTTQYLSTTAERAGASIAGDCDLNQDGRPDLAIGAPYATTGSTSHAGRVYVSFGGARPIGGSGTITITGDPAAAETRTGASVACAGDVNGDAIDDLLVGAEGFGPAGRAEAGAAYVVFGATDLGGVGTIDLASLGSRGFRIDGPAAGAFVAGHVAGVGDLDGDGKAEVAVSSFAFSAIDRTESGTTYVVAGRSTTATVDLADASSSLLRLDGPDALAHLGKTIAVGDLTGDGVPELAAAASGVTGPHGADSGAVYIVRGTARGAVDLGTYATNDDILFPIWGGAAADQAGTAIAAHGDANGDGQPDLIIGGNDRTDDAVDVGVVFGKASRTAVDLADLGAGGYRITRPASGVTSLGTTLAGVGDVNADGRGDVLVGMPQNPKGGAYLVYGQAGTATIELGQLTADAHVAGARYLATATANRRGLGVGLSAAGDMNGDGYPDVALSAQTGTGSQNDNRGYVHVVHLPDPADSAEPEPTPAPEITVDWGIRQELRAYVYARTGAAAYQPGVDTPPLLAEAGATCLANPALAVGGCDPRTTVDRGELPAAFRFTPIGAQLDADAGEGVVASRGRVVLDYPEHCFQMAFVDPTWTVAGASAHVDVRVIVDSVEGCSAAGIPGQNPGDSDSRIAFGTFPLAGPVAQTDTTMTWQTQAGTLTAAGAQAVGVLSPGATLDPARITVSKAIGSLPEEEPAPPAPAPQVVVVLGGDSVTAATPPSSAGAPVEQASTNAPETAAREPAPAATSSRVTGKVAGRRAAKQRVTIVLPSAIGPEPKRVYGVWLTKGGERVATGRVTGTRLELRVLSVSRGTGKRKRSTYPRLHGTYTLRPATAGTGVPTLLLRVI